jgi:hypothetical protein
MAAQLSEELGGVPVVLACTGTTQAGAAAITSKNTSLNGQSSATGAYLPTATSSSVASKSLYSPYYLNYSTLSAANPVIYVGLGGYLNGTLNGSLTLSAGQNAICWQQANGVFYSLKNTS